MKPKEQKITSEEFKWSAKQMKFVLSNQIKKHIQ